MKKFVCSVCGYVYEGEAAPEKCPICGAPASKFVEQSGDMTWAAEHVVGVAADVPEDIKADLINHRYSLIFNNQEIQTDQVESLFIGTEDLSVHLDQFMLLASQQSVTFKELRGLSFVVLNDIGPWKKVIQDNIPDAKFLYQTQRDALAEITKFAAFPSFTTNVTDLVENHADANLDRVELPISDEAAKMPFYVSYLKSQRPQLQNILKQIVELWP